MTRQEIIAEKLDPVPERYALGVPNSDQDSQNNDDPNGPQNLPWRRPPFRHQQHYEFSRSPGVSVPGPLGVPPYRGSIRIRNAQSEIGSDARFRIFMQHHKM
jgi:hypothetical protein